MMDEAGRHIQEIVGSVRKELGSMAGSPWGQRERSAQEKAGQWRKITALPQEEMQQLFKDMAARAGHSPYEETPCEVCDMVATHGLGIK